MSKSKSKLSIGVTSTAFSEEEIIPVKYTCDGKDVSPAIAWTNVPGEAKSFVLICEDPDAPSGNFVHWLLYNIPFELRELPEAVAKAPTVFSDVRQGRNDFDVIGYRGPCPPANGPHRYFFRVYALDTLLQNEPGATKDEITGAMKGHILDSGYLMGKYQRK